jgi:hypothetical protein
MLQAEMKGKVPEVEGKEDVLTSNVFGLLRYVHNPDVLRRILDQARALSGQKMTECVGLKMKLVRGLPAVASVPEAPGGGKAYSA